MDKNRFLLALVSVASVSVVLSGIFHARNEEIIQVSEELPTEQVTAYEPLETTNIQEESESIDAIEVKTYRVTAYCPCEICCGKWAKNRPLDENGEPIVVGSWGVELVNGYSAASPMAFGTKVYLDGIGTVEVQDRTAKWVVDKHGEDIIDIYMTDHKAAEQFEVKYLRGVIQ